MDNETRVSVRCDGPTASNYCTCESCLLNKKISFTKEWLSRLSEQSRQMFMQKILDSCNSLDLISSLVEQFKPLQCKDLMYAKSKACARRVNISNTTEMPHEKGYLAKYIAVDRTWFEAASSWSKLNYLLRIFQHCGTDTLDFVKHILHVKYEKARKLSAKSASTKRYFQNSPEEYEGELGENESNSNSESQNQKFCLQSKLSEQRKDRVAESSFTFSSTPQECFKEANISLNKNFELQSKEVQITLRQTGYSTPASRLSARCYPYPYNSKISASRHHSKNCDSGSDDYLSLDETKESSTKLLFRNLYQALPKQRDFIRQLPIHLSKCILGFLDVNSLVNCVCVSKHWRILAEEVNREMLTQQITREDVMLIQGSTESIPNPLYARIVPLHVPTLSESGEIIINNQARHIDVSCDNEEFEKKDMQNCYDGIETTIVAVEERNIYCGAYNVLVLNQSKDKCRVTYYNGGELVPVASMDRRIRLLDVKSGRCEKTITEHVGSVKSVCTDESRGFVISGSYDTTIRLWDIKSGRCHRIFLGHKSSVIALSMHDRYLASGSYDKTCKVWNMKTGKCVRTFRHRNVIQTVAIGGNLLLTGCTTGKARIWDFKAAKLLKLLDGHMGPITCAKFNENHIITGSKDCYVMAWSAKGDYKRCLRTFRHPKEVNCLELMYCRIITGSADGKHSKYCNRTKLCLKFCRRENDPLNRSFDICIQIRLWNLLDGDCLRIIRGNSRNDPITALYASDDRMIVNTRSNLLLYNFEPIEWDYKCPVERASEFAQRNASATGDQRAHSHTFNKLRKLRRKGSEWIQYSNSDHQVHSSTAQKTQQFERSMRVQSAPVRPVVDSIHKHIARVQSAVAQRKNILMRPESKYLVTKPQDLLKNNWTTREENQYRKDEEKTKFLSSKVSPVKTFELDKTPSRPYVFARSRSAPAHRTRTLPPKERGLTTSSNIQVKITENRIGSSKQKKEVRNIRPFSASTTMLRKPTDLLYDLKLKSFYQQIDYEAELTQQRI